MMLSIVYLTCNRSEELKKSILSCEDHISVPHEYVVVDNGSKDNTGDMIASLKSSGLDIRYLLQDRNRGVAGGRNIGFREAKGDICYFIDDDATVITDGPSLDNAYFYMLEKQDIYAMGTDCYDTERECQLIGCHEIGSIKNTEAKIRGYVGCSHFVRKTAVKTPFLYPDNLMYGSEELYAGLSIYGNGGIIQQYPYLKILHQPSKSTRDSRENRKRNGHINTYVIKKYFLPFPYSVVSSFLFFIRVTRFERLNIRRIISDYKLVHERFDVKYKQKLTKTKVLELSRLFGYRNII